MGWTREEFKTSERFEVTLSFRKINCENTFLIYTVWLRSRDPVGREPAGIPEKRQLKYGVGVLWVSLHPSYDPKTQESNIAILVNLGMNYFELNIFMFLLEKLQGLTWPLQFNANLYQICLPSGSYSDSNAGFETILY